MVFPPATADRAKVNVNDRLLPERICNYWESLVCLLREVKPAWFWREEEQGVQRPYQQSPDLSSTGSGGAGVRFVCGGWVVGLP